MQSRRIAIAGAGIGGLTAALALAARGFEILLVEKAAALQTVGAGVQLSPNASRILIALGLRDPLVARATSPLAVALNSVRAGGEVARLVLPQRADAPYWATHRADLQAALLQAVAAQPSIDLRLGAAMTDFSTTARGVAVTLANETLNVDALIGADGVGSPTRQKLFAGSAPLFSGRVAWRGVADLATPPEVALWMGPDAHLVAYPIAGGARTNLVATLYGGSDGKAAMSGDRLAAQLSKTGWPDAPRRLIAAAETLTPYPLMTVEGLSAWSSGPVALLGDAAHAMLPFAAQGAAMAIEDAAVLAHCAGTVNDNLTEALARYAALRRPRVARVANAAAQSGRIYHMRGAMALARDSTIRLLGGSLLLRRQNWIYGWRCQ